MSLFLAGMQDVTQSDILKKLDELPMQSNAKSVHGGVLVNTEEIDDYGMPFDLSSLHKTSSHISHIFLWFY